MYSTQTRRMRFATADGSRRYGPVAPRWSSREVSALRGPVINLSESTVSWRRLWEIAESELKRRDYSPASLSLYRQVLRGFYRHARADRPSAVTPGMVRSYIHSLRAHEYSWNWLAANICVLRTVFDKLGGMTVSAGLTTPKRPDRLPTILNRREAVSILRAAPTVRDRLLLGLMYLCG
jgi:integrase/recombinase XerD